MHTDWQIYFPIFIGWTILLPVHQSIRWINVAFVMVWWKNSDVCWVWLLIGLPLLTSTESLHEQHQKIRPRWKSILSILAINMFAFWSCTRGIWTIEKSPSDNKISRSILFGVMHLLTHSKRYHDAIVDNCWVVRNPNVQFMWEDSVDEMIYH